MALAGAAFALAAPGCYGGKTWESVQRIEVQNRMLDSLSRVQRSELSQLRQDYEKQSEFMRSSRADTDTRIAELAHRLDVVVGKLEDNNNRFSEVLQRFDLSRRSNVIDTTGGGAGSAPPAGAVVVPGGDPKPLYDAAYADFTAGRYDLARSGFQQFVSGYPQTELARHAQYWIGESYYQQK